MEAATTTPGPENLNNGSEDLFLSGLATSSRSLDLVMCCLCGLTIIGNLGLLVWLNVSGREDSKCGFLLKILAFVNTMVGVYAGLAGAFSISAKQGLEWSGQLTTCKALGTLGLLVYQLLIWTHACVLLHLLSWQLLPRRLREGGNCTIISITVLLWLAVAMISFLPVTALQYFSDTFYGKPLCTPLSVARTGSWAYTVFVASFSSLALAIMTVCFVALFCHLARHRPVTAGPISARVRSKTANMVKRLCIITLPSCLLWLFLLFVLIPAFSGVHYSRATAEWVLGAVLPLSATTTPLLYLLGLKRRLNCDRALKGLSGIFSRKGKDSGDSKVKEFHRLPRPAIKSTKDATSKKGEHHSWNFSNAPRHVHWIRQMNGFEGGSEKIITGVVEWTTNKLLPRKGMIKMYPLTKSKLWENEVKILIKLSGRSGQKNVVDCLWYSDVKHTKFINFPSNIDVKNGEKLPTYSRYLCTDTYNCSLRHYFEDHIEQLSEVDVHTILNQIAEGLKFLSDSKVVHYNLTAKNILVGGLSQVKRLKAVISDFTQSMELRDDEEENHLFGEVIAHTVEMHPNILTPSFKPVRSQASVKNVDQRSFALIILESLATLGQKNGCSPGDRLNEGFNADETTANFDHPNEQQIVFEDFDEILFVDEKSSNRTVLSREMVKELKFTHDPSSSAFQSPVNSDSQQMLKKLLARSNNNLMPATITKDTLLNALYSSKKISANTPISLFSQVNQDEADITTVDFIEHDSPMDNEQEFEATDDRIVPSSDESVAYRSNELKTDEKGDDRMEYSENNSSFLTRPQKLRFDLHEVESSKEESRNLRLSATLDPKRYSHSESVCSTDSGISSRNTANSAPTYKINTYKKVRTCLAERMRVLASSAHKKSPTNSPPLNAANDGVTQSDQESTWAKANLGHRPDSKSRLHIETSHPSTFLSAPPSLVSERTKYERSISVPAEQQQIEQPLFERTRPKSSLSQFYVRKPARTLDPVEKDQVTRSRPVSAMAAVPEYYHCQSGRASVPARPGTACATVGLGSDLPGQDRFCTRVENDEPDLIDNVPTGIRKQHVAYYQELKTHFPWLLKRKFLPRREDQLQTLLQNLRAEEVSAITQNLTGVLKNCWIREPAPSASEIKRMLEGCPQEAAV